MKRASTAVHDEYEPGEIKRPLLQESKVDNSQKPWRWVRVCEYIKRGALNDIRVTIRRIYSSS
jgi:hypothetical protein